MVWGANEDVIAIVIMEVVVRMLMASNMIETYEQNIVTVPPIPDYMSSFLALTSMRGIACVWYVEYNLLRRDGSFYDMLHEMGT